MRTYTQEEKQAVIDRVISGEPSAHILADTGIPKSTFYSWLRAYREEQEDDNRRTVNTRNFHLLEKKGRTSGRYRGNSQICNLHAEVSIKAAVICC